MNSIPGSLTKEAFQQLEMKGKTLAQTTLGDIHQHVMRALQSLCNTRNFFKDFNKEAHKFEKACNKLHFLSKCWGKDGCDCSFIHKKKKTTRNISSKTRASRDSRKDSLEERNPPGSQVSVSYAKGQDIMPKIVPTKIEEIRHCPKSSYKWIYHIWMFFEKVILLSKENHPQSLLT